MRADDGALAQMTVMPYARVVAQHYPVFDDCRFVYERAGHERNLNQLRHHAAQRLSKVGE